MNTFLYLIKIILLVGELLTQVSTSIDNHSLSTSLSSRIAYGVKFKNDTCDDIVQTNRTLTTTQIPLTTSLSSIVNNLKRIINSYNDYHNDMKTTTDVEEEIITTLKDIFENEEGFLLVDRDRRDLFVDQDYDASGDFEPTSNIYQNSTLYTLEGSTITTAPSTYSSQCPCEKGEKGERGERGEPGVCPDCSTFPNQIPKECSTQRINLDRLTQAIRQLIDQSKRIAHRNAQQSKCACPLSSSQSSSTNIRTFRTVQEAMENSFTYPDHTYVHIVNQFGHLDGVFIRISGNLIPISLDSKKCSDPLPCSELHLFALGPNIRKLCSPNLSSFCTKLSDFDSLCSKVSEQQKLPGFYRAFISSSTQWLSHLFDGICTYAKIVNMQGEILFETIDDIFDGKPSLSYILDLQGYQPKFQYFWHGSLMNGTASNNTCLDWSHQDQNVYGIASILDKHSFGLFQQQFTWPCSTDDSNIGILCIETNCEKHSFYGH